MTEDIIERAEVALRDFNDGRGWGGTDELEAVIPELVVALKAARAEMERMRLERNILAGELQRAKGNRGVRLEDIERNE
jgi:hypothetical protein